MDRVASQFSGCLMSALTNCTTRQLELLQKFKGGRKIVNESSHILHELLYHKHWSSLVIIETAAILGFIFWFAGFRLLKAALFFAGFIIGFLVVYAFSPLLVNTKFCCGAKGKREVHLGLSAVIGIVVGVVSLRLYRFGVFAVGQCFGLIVALSILCTPLHIYFENNVTYSLFMVTLSCIFGSATWKFEKPIVVITTSCGGSLAFLYGVDHFARTSFSITVESLIFRIKDVIFDGLHSEYTNWKYHARALTHYKALHFEREGSLKTAAILLTTNNFPTQPAIPIFVVWGVMTALGCLIQYNFWTAKETSEGSCRDLQSMNCCSTLSKSDYA